MDIALLAVSLAAIALMAVLLRDKNIQLREERLARSDVERDYQNLKDLQDSMRRHPAGKKTGIYDTGGPLPPGRMKLNLATGDTTYTREDIEKIIADLGDTSP